MISTATRLLFTLLPAVTLGAVLKPIHTRATFNAADAGTILVSNGTAGSESTPDPKSCINNAGLWVTDGSCGQFSYGAVGNSKKSVFTNANGTQCGFTVVDGNPGMFSCPGSVFDLYFIEGSKVVHFSSLSTAFDVPIEQAQGLNQVAATNSSNKAVGGGNTAEVYWGSTAAVATSLQSVQMIFNGKTS